MRKLWTEAKYRPLLIGGLALIALPFVMRALGLSVNTASQMVTLAIAALGLNMLVGFTGLTSFGHSAWFGIGAYAAAIAQKHWFAGQIVLPMLFSIAFVAVLSLVVGALILRRRGVYFALLTLAFVALTYTVAFRWTELTGGEDGLGGLSRGGVMVAIDPHEEVGDGEGRVLPSSRQRHCRRRAGPQAVPEAELRQHRPLPR